IHGHQFRALSSGSNSGGSGVEPSSGGSGVEPSSGGSGVEPSSGGSGVEPSSGGSGVEPSSGGSGVEPSSGGSWAWHWKRVPVRVQPAPPWEQGWVGVQQKPSQNKLKP
uniref:Uncharacterized protein n=1 Tax=Oryzias latipes TaxID=8090 RepID=A0A3P9KHR5_ORYLA